MSDPMRVTYSGPFFRTDVGKKVKAAINTAVTDVAKDGKRNVQAQLTPGHGVDTGAYRRGIKRRKRGFTATVSASNAMIAAWLEGRSRRNRTTRFPGYGIFRSAFATTDRNADAIRTKLRDSIVRELS